MTKLDELLTGTPVGSGESLFPGVYLGTVQKSTDATLTFVLDAEGIEMAIGPVAYPRPWWVASTESAEAHTHGLPEIVPPSKGTKIAVAFSEGDVDKPLVLAIYGWPT